MPEAENFLINDREFVAKARQLRRLRDFILSEGIGANEGMETFSLGPLNQLHYARAGRMPIEREWSMLEDASVRLFRLLPADSRRKFMMREYPSSIAFVAAAALLLAIIAFFAGIFPSNLVTAYLHWKEVLAPAAATASTADLWGEMELISFVVWVISLSALGSVAFISVNALSIQNDATFDITNRKFVWLRIVLGILFGVVISLPSSYNYYAHFIQAMTLAVSDPDTRVVLKAKLPIQDGSDTVSATQIAVLIIPFLIGFSATLFMTIISRLVGGIQTMFGIEKGGSH